MIDLLTVLYQQINNAHVFDTYRNQAPQKVYKNGTWVPTPFPYVVYKLLPVQNTESDRDDYTLEVSCWDSTDSNTYTSTRVEEIADNVKQALTRFRNLDNKNLVITSRPNIGYIPDPQEKIKRYDVSCTLMVYRR